jgi:pimeloyl-ACP methyl ester carboxylesterase
MDPSRYKQLKTQRGFTYSYYWSPPATDKPVLLFAHGFAEGSFLWRKQVPFFEQLGYGLVVPELLGYGGTDKPTDPKFYIGSGHAQDIVDIFDAEGVNQVIAIGHDWYTARELLTLILTSLQLVSKGSSSGVSAAQLSPPARLRLRFSRQLLHSAAPGGWGPSLPACTDKGDVRLRRLRLHALLRPARRAGDHRETCTYQVFTLQIPEIRPSARPLILCRPDRLVHQSALPRDNPAVEGQSVRRRRRPSMDRKQQAVPPPVVHDPRGTPTHPQAQSEKISLTIFRQEKDHLRKSWLRNGIAAPLCWYRAMIDQATYEDDARAFISSFQRDSFLFIYLNFISASYRNPTRGGRNQAVPPFRRFHRRLRLVAHHGRHRPCQVREGADDAEGDWWGSLGG